MLKWGLGTIAGIIIGIAAYFIWYLGGFKPVLIAEKNHNELHLLYRDHVGAYHKIAPVIISIEQWTKEHGFDCKLSFGQYLDDPQVIEEGRLHSRGGCLIEAPENFPESLLKVMEPDMKLETIPAGNYVQAIFEGSPGIGPMKVYPKVEDYFAEKKTKVAGPVIEIYDVHPDNKMTTTYLFPMGTPTVTP